MSKTLSAVVVLLLLAAHSAAQIKGPQEVTVAVGRLASVPLAVDGDESDYQVLGSDVDAFREYTPDPKQIRLRLIGYAPGTSYVVVASTKGGKLQPLFTVKVTVTGSGPTPPGPGPTPDPVPPLDPLAAKFRDAFKASGFTRFRDLAIGLDACGKVVSEGQTAGAFFSAAKAMLKSAMDDQPLPAAVQALLTAETAAVLPKDPAAKIPARETVALYTRLAAAVRTGGAQ